MITSEMVGVEWVIACLAPRDIAPHPNFRSESISAPGLTALCVQFNFRDYEHYRGIYDALSAGGDPDGRSFLDSAVMVVESESPAVGMARLQAIGARGDLSVGQRAAALLLAAVAAGELDQIGRVLESLQTFHSEIEGLGLENASLQLIEAAVAQQIAFRQFELGMLQNALENAEVVRTLTSSVNSSFDTFHMSAGVDFDSRESQRRVLDLLSASALGLLAVIGRLDAKRDLIRSTPPVIALHQRSDLVVGLDALTEREYRSQYSSGSIQRLSGGPVDTDSVLRPMYAAMVGAELSASLEAARSARISVARAQAILFQRTAASAELLSNALRLFRQADAREDLNRLLREVRFRGPLEILRDSAVQILDSDELASRPGPCGLAILGAAGDLLPPEYKRSAIRVALDFPNSGNDGRLVRGQAVDWKLQEQAFDAIRLCLPGANLDELVARQCIQFMASSGVQDSQLAFSAVVRLAGCIDWSKVSSETRGSWASFAESVAGLSDINLSNVLMLASLLRVDVGHGILDRMSGLQRTVALINGSYGTEPSAEIIGEVAADSLESVRRIQSDATLGSIALGGYSVTALAAHLIVKFGRAELWPEVANTLLHPGVSSREKIDALDVFSIPEFVVPARYLEQFRESSSRILSSGQVSFLGESPDLIDIAWRKFQIAQRLLRPADASLILARYASAGDPGVRMAVADALRVAAYIEPSNELPVVLLVQLSDDVDIKVQQVAARALADISTLGTAERSSLAVDAVRELFGREGVGVVLGCLRGLMDSLERGDGDDQWIRPAVRQFSEDHLSSLVRQAAKRALQASAQ